MKLCAFLSLFSLVVLDGSALRAQPDEGRVRDELRKVFERPEFKADSTVSQDNWIVRQLREFFEWLGTLQSAAPVLYWLIISACIGLLLALVFVIVRAVRRSVFVGGTKHLDGNAKAQSERQSAFLKAEADLHASSGEYTAAVRCLFVSLVHAFDEGGQLSFRPALTNREYLHGFASRPALVQGLHVFVDMLDSNWYGQQPTTKNEYLECLGLYDRLRLQA